ncbi:MAG TPA: outer membrane protein assembly factor BamD [Nevskiaceae bacterium]|nr:outer membrane protein assembly factor BamD [Nevskiaceae bacterium]
MNIWLRAPGAVILGALMLLGAACSSDPDRLPPDNPFRLNDSRSRTERELRLEASALYRLGREALDASDFLGAVQRYDQLASRYPFTDYATQGQLEKVYALYRSFEPDRALSAADKFLREHPRHPAVDYLHYLKGLINFDRDRSFGDAIGMDGSKRDVGYSRRAFDDFALLLQRFPDSRYAGDARQRMVYLRNRIAEHELHVVRFYVQRGAYVAAAKRAEAIISQYPGAPAVAEALDYLESSYRESGLTAQAEDVRRLRAAQPVREGYTAADQDPRSGRSWLQRLTDWWPFGEDEVAAEVVPEVPAPPPAEPAQSAP